MKDVRAKLDINVVITITITATAGELPEDIIHPVLSFSTVTWFIGHIHY
jgi:hypothetical protein